jgi:hypothetical protein
MYSAVPSSATSPAAAGRDLDDKMPPLIIASHPGRASDSDRPFVGVLSLEIM